jgi:type I restriction enzyme R subunit
LQGRNSGGVFLTTIHKFTEDTQLLTDRSNVICISDEAHRSQTNLNQKITYSENGVKKTLVLLNICTILCRMLRM